MKKRITTPYAPSTCKDSKKIIAFLKNRGQALIRGCGEELNVLLSVGDAFVDVIHEYSGLMVYLTLLNPTISERKPSKLEHNDIQRGTLRELDYEFCLTDEEIWKNYKA